MPLSSRLLLLMTFLVPLAAHAEDTPSPPQPCKPLLANEKVRLDADEIPLGELSRLVSCALERNLLLTPPTLGGKAITALAPRPLGRRELLTVWHTALERHDLVEERRGAVYLVRPARPSAR